MIDINSATQSELQEALGLGRGLAARIVDHREAHGAFMSLDDLGQVEGVGRGMLGRMEGLVAFGSVPGAPVSSRLVDLNRASREQLLELPGVGRALADRIVDHRDRHGPFAGFDDLMAVDGVGRGLIGRLDGLVSFGDGDGQSIQRPDVIQIRFRAEDDGNVTKVIHALGIEDPFVDPYPYGRGELLDALQQSVVPVSFDPGYQEDVGNQLIFALLGAPGSEFASAIGSVMGSNDRPTLQLVFDEGSALVAAQLPWEIIHDGGGPVLAAERLRMNRHITYFGDRGPFEEVDPLRVLYLEARPKDAGRLPNLTDAYMDAVGRLGDRIQTRLIRHATFSDLEAALSSETYHIVHYDGHGSFDGTSGYLLFEDGARKTDWVASDRLAGLLGGSDVRLVVLAACQGSTIGGFGIFQSTAPALIRAGVPAVVANQFAVYTDAEEAFVYEFYASLARGESISAAVADGRVAMAPIRGHYFLPTLYLRVADGEGYLFGGEPETHRRWRRSELRKLAAWWWAMTEIARALYLEGILRWQGQVVEPTPPPPTQPDSARRQPAPRREEAPSQPEPVQRGTRDQDAEPERPPADDGEVWSPVGLWRIVGEPSTGEVTGNDEDGYISTTLTARPIPGFERSVGLVQARFRRTGPRTFEGEQQWLMIGSGADAGWAPAKWELTDRDTIVGTGLPPGQDWGEVTIVAKRVGREVVDELIEQGYGGEPEEQRAGVSVTRFAYVGDHAGSPCFHVDAAATGLQGVELRAAVFVFDEAGRPVNNSGAAKYRTPNDQLTVQMNLTPGYDKTTFSELEFTIPYNQFWMGRHTYSAKLEIWRKVGSAKGDTLATSKLSGTFWVNRET